MKYSTVYSVICMVPLLSDWGRIVPSSGRFCGGNAMATVRFSAGNILSFHLRHIQTRVSYLRDASTNACGFWLVKWNESKYNQMLLSFISQSRQQWEWQGKQHQEPTEWRVWSRPWHRTILQGKFYKVEAWTEKNGFLDFFLHQEQCLRLDWENTCWLRS